MLSLSSSLPLCNSIVVLDECPPIKGDGLSLPGRLLVDGCEGEGGRRKDCSQDEITPINKTEASVIRAEGNGV